MPHQLRISPKTAGDRCISCPLPAYPEAAHVSHATGEVLLDVFIGADGAVENLHVVSGPKLLQQAALDAVRTWKYKPFTIRGQGMPVATQVTVRFTLNGHE